MPFVKMGLDPLIIRNAAESVRAEVLPREPALKLEPSLVDKIARKVPIFAGMTPAGLRGTLAVADHVQVKAGGVVFAEGDIGNSCYVLIAGEVVVEKQADGRKVELARLGPGECFGEMALVGKEVRSATVRALDDVVAMRYYRELVEGNAEAAVVIYRNIARVLAARLSDSSVRLADLMPPGG